MTNGKEWCIIVNVVSNTVAYSSREWRNWQTRTFEGRVVHTVRVQVPFLAPKDRFHMKPVFFADSLSEENMKEYFNCIMDIGEQMLICGAEVHRAEDSINRMCYALGAIRSDVFIITSSMVATIYTEDGTFTQTRRISGIGTDIERLHRLNSLSRKICVSEMSPEEIRAEFDSIKNSKHYPFWLEIIAYSAVAAAFTVFFGGGLAEAIVSVLFGAVVRFLVYFTDKAEINKIFAKFLCSFIVSLLAFLSAKCGVISDIDNVIIGNIMLLISGVGLTKGLRDLLTGDSIAGLLRLIEALLSALAIAAGYFLLVSIVGGAAV